MYSVCFVIEHSLYKNNISKYIVKFLKYCDVDAHVLGWRNNKFKVISRLEQNNQGKHCMLEEILLDVTLTQRILCP